jgi:hypothetical protein
MYVCVCIFRYIHTSYIQPVSHTYTYRHAGSLMTSGPGPRSRHALAARITHAIRRATPRPAHSSPARSHPPHTARPARHPRLLAAMPFGRPLVPLHDAQSCAHSTHRLRRPNTASPQVAPHLAIPHCTYGPNTPRPGAGLLADSDDAWLARVTPFASHLLTPESWGQGVFLQMGGPPNTFTGATQPIPVGSDGSVQAGPPDAIAGRDTHAMRLRV